jgi:hypothetical protein
VLEVLLEVTKFCDLYLMERVLDDESEVCVSIYQSFFMSYLMNLVELKQNTCYMLQVHYFPVLSILFNDQMIL